MSFAEEIKSAYLAPEGSAWWFSNCPVSKCYDGITSASAEDTCASFNTNLCHTDYSNEDDTITYTFKRKVFFRKVIIHNKLGNPERFEYYEIKSGDDVNNMVTCASGRGDSRRNQIYEQCCGMSGRVLQLVVQNARDYPINIREFIAEIGESGIHTDHIMFFLYFKYIYIYINIMHYINLCMVSI